MASLYTFPKIWNPRDYLLKAKDKKDQGASKELISLKSNDHKYSNEEVNRISLSFMRFSCVKHLIPGQQR